MSNWCNVSLKVYGSKHAVVNFAKKVRQRKHSYFRPDMLHGEGGELASERLRAISPSLAEKWYRFQVRNDDGLEHFKRISVLHPTLRFILVYGDSSCDSFGSYLIDRSKVQNFELSSEKISEIYRKHLGDDEDSYEDWKFWEANWEMMDIAENHWKPKLLRWSKPKTAR